MSPLFGPDPRKILDRGAPASGRIVGIRVRWTHDDDAVRLDEFAVETQGRTLGVRQLLAPEYEVRLGMAVNARVDKNAAVIEWGEVSTGRWKALKDPPAPGIEDDSDGLGKARGRWIAATATIERLTERKMLMGIATVVDAVVVVHAGPDGDYELTIERLQPAFYAAHLFAAGVTLPVWIDPKRPDRVKVDWAQAAVAEPGVGRPPAWTSDPQAPGRAIGNDLTGGGAAAGAGGIAAPAAPPTSAPPAPAMDPDGFAARMLAKAGIAVDGDPRAVEDEVGWDAFVAVQRAVAAEGWVVGEERQEQLARRQGIAAGAWPDARRRWMERIGRDLAIGSAYRQAMGG
jgi:hypothetical protein